MLRSTLLTLLLSSTLVSGASAQVVSNGGYAAVAPPPPQVLSTATELGIPSVPAINTPFAHVGPEGPPQQAETVQPEETNQGQETVVQIQNPAPMSVQVNSPSVQSQPFNFGAATISTNPYQTGASGTNGKSLGEIARDLKQKQQTTNAKTFTNSDVDRLNGNQTGGITGATANNNEWPENNGVITPPASQGQGTLAAPPSTPQSPAPNTGKSPFAPHSPNEATPPNATPMPPQNAPQANAKPSASEPYEMAQNNPANAGIPQDNDRTAAVDNESSSNAGQNSDAAQKDSLPKTASRLPLLGVLGFISVSMGLFVRYQRTKDAK